MRFVNAAAAALVLLLAGAVHGQDEPVSSASPAPTPSNSASSDTAASTGSADQQPTPTPTPTGTTDGSSSSLPSPSGYPDSDLDPATRCQPDQLVAGPFCSPKPHDVWRTDGNYYVTWDNDRWALNSTVIITLNYDEQGGAGPVVKDYTFPNSRGFLTIVRPSLSLPLTLSVLAPFHFFHSLPPSPAQTLTPSPTPRALTHHPLPHPLPRPPTLTLPHTPSHSSHSHPLSPPLLHSHSLAPPLSHLLTLLAPSHPPLSPLVRASGWLTGGYHDSTPRKTGC